MEKIKIICDSLSDITDEYIEKYDIEFMPLTIIINDEQYRDRIDMKTEDFYKRIRQEHIVPKTSQITYKDFYDVFDKYLKEGYSILYISAASSATGTYQSAVMASRDLDDKKIRIVDSNTLCFGIAVLLIEAGKLRDEGLSLDEIVSKVEELKSKTYVTFFCDDLEHLRRGGRISAVKAVIGKVLGIRPVCVIKEGLVENVANARGKNNAVRKLIEVAKENGISDLSEQEVYVGYTDDINERDKLLAAIADTFKPKAIDSFMIGCGIGTHGGPGTTGFICFKK